MPQPDLTKPVSWKNPGNQLLNILQNLQPNILQAHTRERLTLIFLRFSGRTGAQNVVRDIGMRIKSAHQHLQEVEQFKANRTPGSAYIGLGLTAAGYDILGISSNRQPDDIFFQNGMHKSALGDPQREDWESPFTSDLHAVILVGDDDEAGHDAALADVTSVILSADAAATKFTQDGKGLRNSAGEGIEHFGYVDGTSQPLFFTEAVADKKASDGTTNWDPGFGPDRAIIPDRAAPDTDAHFGSYFVYRKLEQNVQAFKGEEEALAGRLGLSGADAERAGAMLVGRFEDGTPLTLHKTEQHASTVPNDFNYDAQINGDTDVDGGKCPHFAHIRKMNPRGRGGFESHEDERSHIMARRGQTYGERDETELNDGQVDTKPTGDVGLLFMTFNASIGEQFEFVQKNWANFSGFPVTGNGRVTGIDPVIGHGIRPDIDCPLAYPADYDVAGEHMVTSCPPQTVKMLGGAYFFMPSLAFMRALSGLE